MRALLTEVGAVSRGHFALSSGRHSDIYVEKFRALELPPVADRLGAALAGRFAETPVDVVLAPAVGGIVLGFCVAKALGVRSIFAERVDGEMRLRRGFGLGPSEQVLVVEDVVTTGKSLREVLEIPNRENLAGIGCLVDRSGGSESVWPARFESLCTLEAVSWAAEDCPLCAAGVPKSAPGSRYLGGEPAALPGPLRNL